MWSKAFHSAPPIDYRDGMKTPSGGLPDQTRRIFGTGASSLPVPPPTRYRGPGLQMVERWTSSRHEAGLPDTDRWDGALVSLAIAMMSGRHVDVLAAHFARSREGLMSTADIERDIELGLDALRRTADTALDLSPVRAAALTGIRQARQPEPH